VIHRAASSPDASVSAPQASTVVLNPKAPASSPAITAPTA